MEENQEQWNQKRKGHAGQALVILGSERSIMGKMSPGVACTLLCDKL